MRRWIWFVLAVSLLTAPVAAQSASREESASSSSSQAEDSGVSKGKMWLILGATVAGVTGMWINFYRRGK